MSIKEAEENKRVSETNHNSKQVSVVSGEELKHWRIHFFINLLQVPIKSNFQSSFPKK